MNYELIALAVMVCFIPFSLYVCHRLPRAAAISVVVLAGSLFLPENTALLKPPVISAIDKERLIYLCALAGILAYHWRAFQAARLGAGLEWTFLLIILSFLGTWAFNTEAILNYGMMQQPLDIYWILARTGDDLLIFALPFVVGRIVFQSRADLRILAYALVGAGLLYVPLIGLEALLNIPFGVWRLGQVIYGLAPQPSVRWGGVQPAVLMDHSLEVASFMAVATIMAAAFAAAKSTVAWRGVRHAHLLTQLGLLLTRVTTANLYGLVFGIGLRVFSLKFSGKLAVIIAAAVCVYPAMRLADVFPNEWLVELARDLIGDDRARSLEGRFLEEDFVFAGLGSRLWFGWGMFDRIPGAVTFGSNQDGLDSFMIIRVGMTGIVGSGILFLWLTIPVWMAWRRLRFVADRESQFLLVGLMLCISARMVDFLMNGLFNFLPFFLAGALYGIAKSISKPVAGSDLLARADLTKGPRPRSPIRRGAGRDAPAADASKR